MESSRSYFTIKRPRPKVNSMFYELPKIQPVKLRLLIEFGSIMCKYFGRSEGNEFFEEMDNVES